MLEHNLRSLYLNIWGAKMLTIDNCGPCLYLSWNEKYKGFGSSPGPLMKPLNHKHLLVDHQTGSRTEVEGLIIICVDS